MHDDAARHDVIAAFKQLRPAPVDGGALAAIAFEGGRRAGRRTARRWRAASAAMAITLVAALAWPRSSTQTLPPPRSGAEMAMTAVQLKSDRAASHEADPFSALLLTEQVMQHGLDGLPPLRSKSAQAEPVRIDHFERGEW